MHHVYAYSEFLTHRIYGHEKMAGLCTTFWDGLLCISSNWKRNLFRSFLSLQFCYLLGGWGGGFPKFLYTILFLFFLVLSDIFQISQNKSVYLLPSGKE